MISGPRSIPSRQRLYYQGMMDNRDDAHIYMTQINTVFKTDLPTGGTQPHISPRNDSIVFSRKMTRPDCAICGS